MYVVTVEFRIFRGQEAMFLAAVKDQAENSLGREDTCLQFDVSTAPDEDGHVFLYEVYENEAAFKSHLETAHFHDFNNKTADWVEAKTVTTWHRVSPN